jgi:hypothetical protein
VGDQVGIAGLGPVRWGGWGVGPSANPDKSRGPSQGPTEPGLLLLPYRSRVVFKLYPLLSLLLLYPLSQT